MMPMYQGEGAGPPPVLAGGGARRAGTTSQHPPPLSLFLSILSSPPFPSLAILGSEKGDVEPKLCL